MQALPKGTMLAMTEVLSERMGSALTKSLGVDWLASKYFGRFANATADDFSRFLKQSGWHGMSGEFLEERANEIMQYSLGKVVDGVMGGQETVDDMGVSEMLGTMALDYTRLKYPNPDGDKSRQMIAEIMAFAGMGAPRIAINQIYQRAQTRELGREMFEPENEGHLISQFLDVRGGRSNQEVLEEVNELIDGANEGQVSRTALQGTSFDSHEIGFNLSADQRAKVYDAAVKAKDVLESAIEIQSVEEEINRVKREVAARKKREQADGAIEEVEQRDDSESVTEKVKVAADQIEADVKPADVADAAMEQEAIDTAKHTLYFESDQADRPEPVDPSADIEAYRQSIIEEQQFEPKSQIDIELAEMYPGITREDAETIKSVMRPEIRKVADDNKVYNRQLAELRQSIRDDFESSGKKKQAPEDESDLPTFDQWGAKYVDNARAEQELVHPDLRFKDAGQAIEYAQNAKARRLSNPDANEQQKAQKVRRAALTAINRSLKARGIQPKIKSINEASPRALKALRKDVDKLAGTISSEKKRASFKETLLRNIDKYLNAEENTDNRSLFNNKGFSEAFDRQFRNFEPRTAEEIADERILLETDPSYYRNEFEDVQEPGVDPFSSTPKANRIAGWFGSLGSRLFSSIFTPAAESSQDPDATTAFTQSDEADLTNEWEPIVRGVLGKNSKIRFTDEVADVATGTAMYDGKTKSIIIYRPFSQKLSMQAMTDVMREEVIHAAFHAVMIQRKQSIDSFYTKVHEAMTPQEKKAIHDVYPNLSKMDSRLTAAEFVRALIQKQLYGRTTEESFGRAGKLVRRLFKSVYNFVSNLFGSGKHIDRLQASVVAAAGKLVEKYDPKARKGSMDALLQSPIDEASKSMFDSLIKEKGFDSKFTEQDVWDAIQESIKEIQGSELNRSDMLKAVYDAVGRLVQSESTLLNPAREFQAARVANLALVAFEEQIPLPQGADVVEPMLPSLAHAIAVMGNVRQGDNVLVKDFAPHEYIGQILEHSGANVRPGNFPRSDTDTTFMFVENATKAKKGHVAGRFEKAE